MRWKCTKYFNSENNFGMEFNQFTHYLSNYQVWTVFFPSSKICQFSSKTSFDISWEPVSVSESKWQKCFCFFFFSCFGKYFHFVRYLNEIISFTAKKSNVSLRVTHVWVRESIWQKYVAYFTSLGFTLSMLLHFSNAFITKFRVFTLLLVNFVLFCFVSPFYYRALNQRIET